MADDSNQNGDERKTKAGRNTWDTEKLKGYWAELQECEQELASEKGAYMSRCKSIRERKDEILQAAKDVDGIPKKILKGLLTEQKKLSEAEAIRDGMEELVDDYDQIKLALGLLEDTPLGQYAMNQASGTAENGASAPN